MKKIIFTALAISTAQAGFIIKIPLEQPQGGSLPSGSIQLKPAIPQEPEGDGTYVCLVPNGNGTLNGDCSNGIFTAKNGLGTLTGTCSGGNYYYKIGLAYISGACNTPTETPVENWQPAEPLYGEWVNNGAVYGCSNWTPATSTQSIGVIFQQTADDCKQDQTTTKQEREKETTTLAYRNLGQPTTETKSIPAHSSRQATGTKETWVPAPAAYTAWTNIGYVYGCSSWTPATSTKPIGVIFQQTADDCKQDQSRNRQELEQETTTLAYRNVGQPTTETKSIPAHSSRQATGTWWY